MTNPVVENDPFGEIKKDGGPPVLSAQEVAAMHARSDRDSSVFAQHHTLGIKHNQASPGDHNHDAKGSRKVGAGLGLSVTGSKGGNVALTNLLTMLAQVIEFTDTTT